MANFWLHGEFMMVEKKKMAKSEGNLFIVQRDLWEEGLPKQVR